MGYSRSPKTLEAIRPLLDDLERGLACVWEVAPGEEHKWAYKVREALYIARLFPDRYPALAQAADAFKVEVAERGRVRAVTAGNTLQPKVLGSAVPIVSQGLDDDQPGLAHKVRSVSLTGSQTAASIMKAWYLSQPSNHPLYFPQAVLDRQELLELYRLAADQHLIFFESEGAITLQRTTMDLMDLAWSPEDLDDGEGESPVDLSFLHP